MNHNQNMLHFDFDYQYFSYKNPNFFDDDLSNILYQLKLSESIKRKTIGLIGLTEKYNLTKWDYLFPIFKNFYDSYCKIPQFNQFGEQLLLFQNQDEALHYIEIINNKFINSKDATLGRSANVEKLNTLLKQDLYKNTSLPINLTHKIHQLSDRTRILEVIFDNSDVLFFPQIDDDFVKILEWDKQGMRQRKFFSLLTFTGINAYLESKEIIDIIERNLISETESTKNIFADKNYQFDSRTGPTLKEPRVFLHLFILREYEQKFVEFNPSH